MTLPFAGQCTPEAQAARHEYLITQRHPIHSKKDQAPEPTPIPTTEAIALWLEARDCYEQRIRQIDANLAELRDL